MKPTAGITGASGFIGKNLELHLKDQGFNVLKLQRKTNDANDIKYELSEPLKKESLKNVDVIVHTAVLHFSIHEKKSNEINLKAAKELIGFAKEHNKFIVFLSTMSAHKQALSNYGKNKLELEKLFTDNGHAVLKLGLVLGNNGGLFNTIVETMKKTSIVPLLNTGKQPIQTLYINDLCKIIENVINKRTGGVYNVAHQTCFPIKEMYAKIGAHLKKQPTFITVPFFMMYYPVKIAETLNISLPVTSESVLGLKQLKCFDTERDLKALDVKLLSFEETLNKLFNNAT